MKKGENKRSLSHDGSTNNSIDLQVKKARLSSANSNEQADLNSFLASLEAKSASLVQQLLQHVKRDPHCEKLRIRNYTMAIEFLLDSYLGQNTTSDLDLHTKLKDHQRLRKKNTSSSRMQRLMDRVEAAELLLIIINQHSQQSDINATTPCMYFTSTERKRVLGRQVRARDLFHGLFYEPAIFYQYGPDCYAPMPNCECSKNLTPDDVLDMDCVCAIHRICGPVVRRATCTKKTTACRGVEGELEMESENARPVHLAEAHTVRRNFNQFGLNLQPTAHEFEQSWCAHVQPMVMSTTPSTFPSGNINIQAPTCTQLQLPINVLTNSSSSTLPDHGEDLYHLLSPNLNGYVTSTLSVIDAQSIIDEIESACSGGSSPLEPIPIEPPLEFEMSGFSIFCS